VTEARMGGARAFPGPENRDDVARPRRWIEAWRPKGEAGLYGALQSGIDVRPPGGWRKMIQVQDGFAVREARPGALSAGRGRFNIGDVREGGTAAPLEEPGPTSGAVVVRPVALWL